MGEEGGARNSILYSGAVRLNMSCFPFLSPELMKRAYRVFRTLVSFFLLSTWSHR